jgi:hypothetical protein
MDSSRPVRTVWNGTMHVRIYEVDEAGVEPGGRALIFETDFGKRYRFVFPGDWRTFNDGTLLRLAEQTPD